MVEVVRREDRPGQACAENPPASLAQALRTMADPAAGARERERAAREVLGELRAWGPGATRRQYGAAMKGLPPDAVEALMEDAIQQTAFAAVSSGQSFRGETAAAARGWLRRVLLNHLAEGLRGFSGRADLPGDWPAQQSHGDGTGAPAEGGACCSAAAVASTGAAGRVAQAVSVLRDLRAFTRRSHSARAAATSFRSVCVYLSHLAGLSTEEQLRLWGTANLTAPPGSTKQRRDHIYQLRHRGRAAIRRALAAIDRDASAREQ